MELGVHPLHMPFQVVPAVELVTALFTFIRPYASMDVQVALEVVLVILAAEMYSTYWAIYSLQFHGGWVDGQPRKE